MKVATSSLRLRLHLAEKLYSCCVQVKVVVYFEHIILSDHSNCIHFVLLNISSTKNSPKSFGEITRLLTQITQLLISLLWWATLWINPAHLRREMDGRNTKSSFFTRFEQSLCECSRSPFHFSCSFSSMNFESAWFEVFKLMSLTSLFAIERDCSPPLTVDLSLCWLSLFPALKHSC